MYMKRDVEIMKHITSRSGFIDCYGQITGQIVLCTLVLERLWRTKFYKHAFFIELIIYYLGFNNKILDGVNMGFYVFLLKSHSSARLSLPPQLIDAIVLPTNTCCLYISHYFFSFSLSIAFILHHIMADQQRLLYPPMCMFVGFQAPSA